MKHAQYGAGVIVALFVLAGPLAAAASEAVAGSPEDMAFYVGGAAKTRLTAALSLSDGTVLIGGVTEETSWIPKEANAVLLKVGGAENRGVSPALIPFLLRLSPDAKQIRGAYLLPKGFANDISAIKTTSLPGMPTGDLYISGRCSDSYVLARLEGNALAKPITGLQWAKHLRAKGTILEMTPWDVGSDGRVIYATGESHSPDWLSVEAMNAQGERVVVPKWRAHWLEGGGEFLGTADQTQAKLLYSGIILKRESRGGLCSWTKADYEAKVPDGNGGFNQGRWPFDGMFPGYWNPETKALEQVNPTGKGWYGYRWGRNMTACVGAIVVDRRDNAFYIGGNNQSKLPDGQPDFEPWVIGYQADGTQKWWVRLYPESAGVSTPDQYVDALAIDYAVPASEEGGALVVVARCHGNNVNNFWKGHEIKHPKNNKKSFQQQFTGTNGNIHYQWIGRMTLKEATMLHASYMGEYAEGAKHDKKTFQEPNLGHWPHFLSGWPNINTTRLRNMSVDAKGRIYIAGVGRRVITTKGAYLNMPSPLADPGKVGQWSDFVRIYRQDLSTLDYSSLVVGVWDWDSGAGLGPITLTSVIPLKDGSLLSIGYAPLSKDNAVHGNEMPARNVPSWGTAKRTTETGVLVRLQTP